MKIFKLRDLFVCYSIAFRQEPENGRTASAARPSARGSALFAYSSTVPLYLRLPPTLFKSPFTAALYPWFDVPRAVAVCFVVFFLGSPSPCEYEPLLVRLEKPN